jgi:hypothetical protein
MTLVCAAPEYANDAFLHDSSRCGRLPSACSRRVWLNLAWWSGICRRYRVPERGNKEGNMRGLTRRVACSRQHALDSAAIRSWWVASRHVLDSMSVPFRLRLERRLRVMEPRRGGGDEAGHGHVAYSLCSAARGGAWWRSFTTLTLPQVVRRQPLPACVCRRRLERNMAAWHESNLS